METSPLLQESISAYRLPHPALQPFIENYIYRRIPVPDGIFMDRFVSLRPTSSLDFFIGSPFDTIDIETGEVIPFVRNIIRGPRTNVMYSLRLKGDFIAFTIIFKATGLYSLLGIFMDMLADKTLDENLTTEFPVYQITELLNNAPDIISCMRIVEPYLLHLVEKRKDVPLVIQKAVNLLEFNRPSYLIRTLAHESFLSLRQLERNFIKYVGVSPKTYFRISRLMKLLDAKKNSPQQKWGSLAHEFGYYDQMHFVKEFKFFFKVTPSSMKMSEFSF